MTTTKYLSEKRLHPLAVALQHDRHFYAFAEFEGKTFPTEKSGRMHKNTWFYQLGHLVSKVLDRANPNWKTTLTQRDGLLIGEVDATLAAANPLRSDLTAIP